MHVDLEVPQGGVGPGDPQERNATEVIFTSTIRPANHDRGIARVAGGGAPTAMLSISTPGLELAGLRANRPDDKLHRSRYALVSKRAQALDLAYREPGLVQIGRVRSFERLLAALY
ncbi:hypothetical protein [Bradyrhizobium sp. 150]|uniref:hypothetical protein n=1 Tax=Bradyrhizobium sp. 150 TaxID=2782625 RepID=UPI001FF71801|nr:hypothetical protein [Bradyrhizobium sp. 150]